MTTSRNTDDNPQTAHIDLIWIEQMNKDYLEPISRTCHLLHLWVVTMGTMGSYTHRSLTHSLVLWRLENYTQLAGISISES